MVIAEELVEDVEELLLALLLAGEELNVVEHQDVELPEIVLERLKLPRIGLHDPERLDERVDEDPRVNNREADVRHLCPELVGHGVEQVRLPSPEPP